MKSKYEKQLIDLQARAYFRAADAREIGIPSRMLAHFCLTGVIERLSHGIYRGAKADSGLDLSMEDLILTATSIPHGIVCLISALCYYGLTDQIMREYWIAIPNKDKSPKRPYTRIKRMRNISLGLCTIPVGNYTMKIFDRERTVIDSFRFLSHEIALKALQAYLISTPEHKPDLTKLSQYAKTLRFNINPYLMALI